MLQPYMNLSLEQYELSQVLAVQARGDSAETLLWRRKGKQLSSSPVAPLTSQVTPQATGTQRLRYHVVNHTNGSFLEDYTDPKDQGPVASWDGDVQAQAYLGGNSPVHRCLLEPPSSRSGPSQQYPDAHAGPDDSHSLSIPDLNASTRKRPCSMRAMADYGSVVRSCSSPPDTAPIHSLVPWQKSLRSGFLIPSRTNHPSLVGRSPPADYIPAETQVVFLLECYMQSRYHFRPSPVQCQPEIAVMVCQTCR